MIGIVLKEGFEMHSHIHHGLSDGFVLLLYFEGMIGLVVLIVALAYLFGWDEEATGV